MRLINTTTYEMHEFHTAPFRLYAILSHRWGDDEISLAQFENQEFERNGELKKGWIKIKSFLDLCTKKGVRWAWVDTCCIDKTSSADLSEAINSMFSWYRTSRVCIAHMPVKILEGEQGPHTDWFGRGWTLQELLAPIDLEFYDRDWKFLGTRQDLSQYTSTTTGIPVSLLSSHGVLDLDQFSVAERFKWAAWRETTRDEDQAYCLMGIFNVNMPLLYGEGQRKAFRRLLLEIAKVTDDESILVFNRYESTGSKLFASSPASYLGNYHSETSRIQRDRIYVEPFQLTDSGLSLRRILYPMTEQNRRCLLDMGDVKLDWTICRVVLLQCHRNSNQLALVLRRLPGLGENYSLLRMCEVHAHALQHGEQAGIFIPDLPESHFAGVDSFEAHIHLFDSMAESQMGEPTGHSKLKGKILRAVSKKYPPGFLGSSMLKLVDFQLEKRQIAGSESATAVYFVTPGIGPSGSDDEVEFSARMLELGFTQEEVSSHVDEVNKIFGLD